MKLTAHYIISSNPQDEFTNNGTLPVDKEDKELQNVVVGLEDLKSKAKTMGDSVTKLKNSLESVLEPKVKISKIKSELEKIFISNLNLIETSKSAIHSTK